MSSRLGVFFLFLFLSLFGFSQSDLRFKLEVSPWQIHHNFSDVSKPFSIAYTTGLNFEQVIPKTIIGFSTGIDYVYTRGGAGYMDLSDKQNLIAVIFEQEINKRFIEIPHHEITLPFMVIFYLSDLRMGIGASYSRYMFGDFMLTDFNSHTIDYGLRAMLGARISKRLSFSMGYYYGLKNIVSLSVSEMAVVDGSQLSGSMRKIAISLSFSIFNSIKDERYYLSK